MGRTCRVMPSMHMRHGGPQSALRPRLIPTGRRYFGPTTLHDTSSHETIYNVIYAHSKGELRKALITYLRQRRSTHKSRSLGTDRRGQSPKMANIHCRLAQQPAALRARLKARSWLGRSPGSSFNGSKIMLRMSSFLTQDDSVSLRAAAWDGSK